MYHNEISQAESLLTQVLGVRPSLKVVVPSSKKAQSQQAAYNFYAHLYLAQVYAATNRAQLAKTEAQTALGSIAINSITGGQAVGGGGPKRLE